MIDTCSSIISDNVLAHEIREVEKTFCNEWATFVNLIFVTISMRFSSNPFISVTLGAHFLDGSPNLLSLKEKDSLSTAYVGRRFPLFQLGVFDIDYVLANQCFSASS